MSKLQDMKGVVEDSNKRLENIYVKGDAMDGKIRLVLDGNRKLKELFIDQEIYESLEKNRLIEALVEGFNKAIEDADHVNENEMKSTAFNLFPGMNI